MSAKDNNMTTLAKLTASQTSEAAATNSQDEQLDVCEAGCKDPTEMAAKIKV